MSFIIKVLSRAAMCVAFVITVLAGTGSAQYADFGIPKIVAMGLLKVADPRSPGRALHGKAAVTDLASSQGGTTALLGQQFHSPSAHGIERNLPELRESNSSEALKPSGDPGTLNAGHLIPGRRLLATLSKEPAETEPDSGPKPASDSNESRAARITEQ